MVTIDCSTYSAQYEVFATAAAADDADKDTISRNFQDFGGQSQILCKVHFGCE